jgi:hypothetical protein
MQERTGQQRRPQLWPGQLACGLCLLAAVLLGFLAAEGLGQPAPVVVGEPSVDFRIETEVWLGDAKQPLKRTLTLFHNGLAYDFDQQPDGPVTVVDVKRQRILLIEPALQLRTVVSTEQLSEAVEQMRLQASQGAMNRYLQPSRTEEDPDNGQITVAAEGLRYEADYRRPPDSGIALQYADFAKWAAMLNAVYGPRVPPFVRLELNQQLADRGGLPVEIERVSLERGKPSRVTMRMTPNWRLSTDDQQRIRRVGNMLADYRLVSESEYFAARQAAQPTAPRR